MHKKISLALSVLICSCANGFAESSEAIDPYSFAMPEIVVTATRTSMNTQSVPAAVEVITAEEIKAKGAYVLKDIIGSATGVAITRANGRASLSVRGFDARYSMILVDGKRIPAEPDPLYELDRISLENVERIEIVRGPVSSLYGADALGGVINIITKTSKENSFTFNLDQGFLSRSGDKTGRYAFTYDSGRQGKTSIVLSGSLVDNDASLKDDGTTYQPFGNRKTFSSRFEYYPTDKETVTLTTSYMKENTHEYAIAQTLAGTIRTNIHDDNKRSEYALSYKKLLINGEFFVSAYHSIWDKYNDTVNRANGQYTNAAYGYRTISGLEARISKTAGDNHLLTLGGEFRPELFRGTGTQSGKGTFTKTYHGKTYTGSEVKTDYSALYFQDEWKIVPKLLMVTSARYDDSNRFDNNVSPKIGLTYTPEPGWRLKFNAGQGFRVPSPNQLYRNLNVTRNGKLVSSVGNPNLKPEDSTSYDVSVERDFGKASSKLTYFSSKIKDMIDEVWVDTAKIEFQNINRASIQGIEAEVSSPLSDRLSWSANYTYLDATNDLTGARLYNRARHKISSRFSYHPEDSWTANLWVDSYLDYWFQPAATVSTNKSYTLWNINAEKQLTKNQSLLLGIENLFNHKDDDLSLPGSFIHVNYKLKL